MMKSFILLSLSVVMMHTAYADCMESMCVPSTQCHVLSGGGKCLGGISFYTCQNEPGHYCYTNTTCTTSHFAFRNYHCHP